MNDPEHVKKSNGFNPKTGARKKPLPVRNKKGIFPNKDQNKKYVARALGFESGNGARPIEQPYENYSREKNNGLDDLQNPSAALITELIRVAKSDKSVQSIDSALATQVIVDILKACFFFQVTDISHIAYIFATAAHESRFGKRLEEEGDRYDISQYEPVFSVGKDVAEKENGVLYKQLESGNAILQELVGFLEKLVDKGAVSERQLSDSVEKILTYIKVNKLNPNEQFLKDLKQLKEKDKLIFMKVCEDFLELILEDVDDLFTQDYLGMKEIAVFAKKMGVEEKELQWELGRRLSEESRRVYRITLLPHIIKKLLARIQKANKIGNTQKGDGEKFKGRGLVQITNRSNYKKYAELVSDEKGTYYKALSGMGMQLDDDGKQQLASLGEETEVAENIPIAAVIAVGGMSRDGFASKSKVLSKYGEGNSFQFFNAREIVNVDKSNKFEQTGMLIGKKIEDTARAFMDVLRPKKG